MNTSRRGFLAVCGSAAVAGCSGLLGGDDEDAPSGPVATAPIPDDPGRLAYATMGSGDADVTAIYFGNWKCPFCADFSTGFLGDIVTDYVEPGDVDIVYRALAYVGDEPFLGPDAPRASRAGIGVWSVDPESYWAFHEYVMANQPPESEEWATADELVSMAESAGVSGVDEVRTVIEDESYNELLRRTTRRADALGVQGTPTLAIGDNLVNGLDEEAVRSALDEATA